MPAERVIAYIGLGSNLEDSVRHVTDAIAELNRIDDGRCVAVSSLYRSAPMGPQDQPDYINAVVALETELPPLALLSQLQKLESLHHRVRGERWGPRTLDLDILLYGNKVIDEPTLTVPHPGLAARNFVLVPLYEIASDLRLPDNRRVATLVEHCAQQGLERLS